MTSVPVNCPHCYKNVHSPTAGAGGLIRCDACGHTFPASGGMASSYTPPSYSSAARPGPPAFQQPASYGLPSSSVSPPPGVKYQPSYPPASGPQNPGNPGLAACGVIAALGFLGLVCCGGLGFLLYRIADKPLPLANQNFNPPPNVNQPPFVLPNFGPHNFNPPQDFPQPPLPVFPEIPPAEPFERIVPPPTIPGTSATPKTLDDFLQAMRTIDAMNFTARQLLDELSTFPVDEARRGEVVDAVLQLLQRAGVHAGGLMAGPGQTVLERWASRAESLKLAQFAAGDVHFARRPVLVVLAKMGGDAETAKALLPLTADPSLLFTLPDVFASIGPEAEEPLLKELETDDRQQRRMILEALGKVGGAKAKAKLQTLINSGDGLDKAFSGRALREIERREAAGGK